MGIKTILGLMLVLWLCGMVTGWYLGRRDLLDSLMRKTVSKVLDPNELHAQA